MTIMREHGKDLVHRAPGRGNSIFRGHEAETNWHIEGTERGSMLPYCDEREQLEIRSGR